MKKLFYGIGFLYIFLIIALGFTNAYAIRHTNDEMRKLQLQLKDLKTVQASMQPQMHENSTIYTFQQYNSYKQAYESVKYKLISYSSDEIILKELKDNKRNYLLKEKDGLITVYLEDGRTIYEYTAIVVTELPDSIQEELKKGIKISDLDALYSFLEHYSS